MRSTQCSKASSAEGKESHQHDQILCLWASRTTCFWCCLLHDAARSSVSPLLSFSILQDLLPCFILLHRPCRVPCIGCELANNVKDNGPQESRAGKCLLPSRPGGMSPGALGTRCLAGSCPKLVLARGRGVGLWGAGNAAATVSLIIC